MPHVARKRFGQNFLVDRSVIDRIVEAIDPRPGDCLVEIGPGTGALTEPLIPALGGAPLQVIELDRDLVGRLRRRFDAGQLIVHEADALEFDFAALAQSGKRLRVVGNLPYNISSPLLFHLLRYAECIRDQHFMLQKEVVLRMVAQPGGRVYGRLSVMLQVRYRMELLFVVRPEAFLPAPKVDSALVRMIPLAGAELAVRDPSVFSAVVAHAFSTRRKMLRNALADFDERVPLAEYGLEPTARAEEIAPALYVAYANALAANSLRDSTP